MMTIYREICNMFMRENVLIRRFCKCLLRLNVCFSNRFVYAYMMLHCGLNTQLENSISFGHACYDKCIKNFWVSEK
jgi:hypothetical protein